MVVGMDSGVGQARVPSPSSHLLAVSPWANYLSSSVKWNNTYPPSVVRMKRPNMSWILAHDKCLTNVSCVVSVIKVISHTDAECVYGGVIKSETPL